MLARLFIAALSHTNLQVAAAPIWVQASVNVTTAPPETRPKTDNYSDTGAKGEVVAETQSAAEPNTSEAVAPRVVVTIQGALVLPPEVYLDALQLPAGARPSANTAAVVRQQLQAFLTRTGFELAQVTTRVEGSRIVAEIDEGKVDRVIYVGRLSFQQVRFKLALVLPYLVFNRFMLDRQVRELCERFDMPGVRWELVRTHEVDHVGPQITKLPTPMEIQVAGTEVLHERRPYEIRIRFPDNSSGSFGVDVRSDYTYGFSSGVDYGKPDWIVPGDRFHLATSAALALRSRIATANLYPRFSRAYFEGNYFTPPFLSYLTPNLWTEANLITRQRADLNLENYWALTTAGALQLQAAFRPGLRFVGGAGFEYRRLFGLETVPGSGAAVDVSMTERSRPFIRAAHESVVNPNVLRWDRRHTLESELRYYFPFRGDQSFAWGELRYQYVKELGWHDFWVRHFSRVSWGEVTFHDEVSAGELLRGLFGRLWVPSGANLELQFRFSLVRDHLKLGVFHSLALLSLPQRISQREYQVELANAFGPSIHLLAADMFQLDMYLAFGFRPQKQFDTAFSLQLQKAF